MLEKIYKLLFFICLVGLVPSFLKADTPPAPEQIEVIAFGAAMIDHLFLISNEQLRMITKEIGNWQSIDYNTLLSILTNNANISKMLPGGSASNFLKGINRLGRKCALLGKVGMDEKGSYYIEALKKQNITSYLQKENLPTGEIISFVTPDGETTCRSYLGGSHETGFLEIPPSLFQGISLLYVEGFQLLDPVLLIRVLEMAKKQGVKIGMNLGNIEIARRNKEFILNILPKYVNFLFCREREAKELFDLPPNQAVEYLGKHFELAVVLMGTRGIWVRRGLEQLFTPSLPTKVINVTGSLDLFASGFLHTYLNQLPLSICSQAGMLLSTYVVKMIGGEISEDIWGEIQQKIDSISKRD